MNRPGVRADRIRVGADASRGRDVAGSLDQDFPAIWTSDRHRTMEDDGPRVPCRARPEAESTALRVRATERHAVAAAGPACLEPYSACGRLNGDHAVAYFGGDRPGRKTHAGLSPQPAVSGDAHRARAEIERAGHIVEHIDHARILRGRANVVGARGDERDRARRQGCGPENSEENELRLATVLHCIRLLSSNVSPPLVLPAATTSCALHWCPPTRTP